jgi:hypothetical protein
VYDCRYNIKKKALPNNTFFSNLPERRRSRIITKSALSCLDLYRLANCQGEKKKKKKNAKPTNQQRATSFCIGGKKKKFFNKKKKKSPYHL